MQHDDTEVYVVSGRRVLFWGKTAIQNRIKLLELQQKHGPTVERQLWLRGFREKLRRLEGAR